MKNNIFSKSLFLSNLKRYWVLPVIVTAIMFLLIPFTIISEKNKTNSVKNLDLQINKMDISQITDTYLKDTVKERLFSIGNALILIVFPIAVSIQVFSFLNKNKRSSFLHGLPLSRKKIYITNIISGLLLMILPYIITGTILIILSLFGGFGAFLPWTMVLQWLVMNVLIGSLFFMFTTLVGMFTGTELSHGILTYILMFIPFVFIIAIEAFLINVIFGFPGFGDNTSNVLHQIPSIQIFDFFMYDSIAENFNADFTIIHFWCYLFSTIGCGIIGYYLYKVRKLERSGEFIVFNTAKLIIKYVLTFLVMIFAYLYNLQFGTNRIWSIIIAILYAFIAYIAIEMVMQRTYKVFKSAKGYLIFAIIIGIIFTILNYDFIGYIKKVPNSNEIEYATYDSKQLQKLSDDIVYYRTQENIDKVINTQKELIQNKDNAKSKNEQYEQVYIEYKLKNGKTISRMYEINSNDKTKDELYSTNEYINQYYSYLFSEKDKIDSLHFTIDDTANVYTMDITRKDNEEMLNKMIDKISKDIQDNKIHIDKDIYAATTNKETQKLSSILIDVIIGEEHLYNYVIYNNVKDNYEITGLINDMIKEGNTLLQGKGSK